tara:strand:+ start:11755 stop:12051 length:297 start_codon:yes stop_codon:yes gene_type:complete
MNSKDDLDLLIGEALENIRNDRKIANEFLNEIANQIAADAENNRSLSPVAAKHIETMQRSNEQLVKIIGLKHKNKNESFELTDADKSNIYDMIQNKES